MAVINRHLINCFIIGIVIIQLVPTSDAGIKQFFGDAYNKVKNVFRCSSHETHDEHIKAHGDESVNTLEGIGDGRSINGDTQPTASPKTPLITTVTSSSTTTDFPQIDIRFQNEDGPKNDDKVRAIIRPPPNCPSGYRPDHTGKCREIV